MNILPVMSDAFDVTAGYTLVAAALSAEGTDYLGFASSIGSLTPTTYLENTIEALYTYNLTGQVSYKTVFAMTGTLAQDVFTSITANGTTLTSASANSYGSGGGSTSWEWYTTRMFDTTTMYSVTIT